MGRKTRESDYLQLDLWQSAVAETPAAPIAEPLIVLPPPATLSRDFRIGNIDPGYGSIADKAAANLDAIRIVKQLEAEDRLPSPAEKTALVRYTGWGALPAVFESYVPAEWKAVARSLAALLTPEEMASARASTPNAHYTSRDVVTAIWAAMERFGFAPGGHILEPALGVGHFFGLMPERLHAGTRRTGIELDMISARIAAKLYPDSTIHAKAFEEVSLPGNFFDAIVSNIPFGNYPVFDPAYRRQQNLTRAIHDYFLVKSLDVLRPGGLLAVITSRFTMDKEHRAVREHLASQGDLLGAIRLPNTAFRANAGTDVTTDIIFMRKRGGRGAVSVAPEAWTGLAQVQTQSQVPIDINEYYARHPEMMLGTMVLESSRYGPAPALSGRLTAASLAGAVLSLPASVYVSQMNTAAPEPRYQASPDPIPAAGTVKEGGFAESGGRIVVLRGGEFETVSLPETTQARIRGMLGIRDAVREVLRTQLDAAPEEDVIVARDQLNCSYDLFVARFGPLNLDQNIRAFSDDPDRPLLVSLEVFDQETKTATKTEIFSRRTLARYTPVESVATAAEALLVSLNETGRVTWSRIESLTGRKTVELQQELGSLVYQNPDGGEWQTADEYLSGDVRLKLRTAESAAKLDAVYERNVKALQEVQPPDLQPGEIEVRLGAPWIPKQDIQKFIAALLEVSASQVKVSYAASIVTWTVELDFQVKYAVSNTTTYGTARFQAVDLIEQALNGRVPTAYDEDADGKRTVNQNETIAARERQQQLKARFSEWIWDDPERAKRLAAEYNFRFNNIRLRVYDGSHLTLPGIVRGILRNDDLAPHQKDAVWRITQGGSHLLAHVVGAGKTWTMAAAAMELRRLELVKKPMFVVPNHLVDQWGAEFLRLYPQARLFVAGKDHFGSDRRAEAMSRIATGNYDAVIVSHRSFELLPVSDEYFQEFMNRQIKELEEEIRLAQQDREDNQQIIKELEKAKKRLVVRLKKRADRERKDRTITFEDLGVDQLFVDEADLYKNLGYITKMNRIAGLPNSDSNRAFDMFLKIRYLQRRNEGRGGVVFATGTPVSNTLAEMYTMLRYLGPELMLERGVEHFDAWAASFAEAVTALELAPDGSGYRMHTRFAKFINLPELLAMFRTVGRRPDGRYAATAAARVGGRSPRSWHHRRVPSSKHSSDS